MKAVVVIAFYVWLALTVVIVLGRLARWSATRQATKRRRQARLAASAAKSATAPATASSPSGSTLTVGLGNTAPAATDTPATQPVAATTSAPPAADAPSKTETGTEAETEAEAETETETALEAEERRAKERRAGDRRVADRRMSERRTTQPSITQLLAGISIPADLTPIVADGTQPTDQATSLICSTRPAYEVGSGIADELERLGYVLTPVGEAALAATRGDDTLTVEINASPSAPDASGVVRYPSASATSVVVDFWVGDGPRPA